MGEARVTSPLGMGSAVHLIGFAEYLFDIFQPDHKLDKAGKYQECANLIV